MKQVAFFRGNVTFETFPDGHTRAHIRGAIQHPILGDETVVHTTRVVQQNEDGSFETSNTLYKPFPTKE